MRNGMKAKIVSNGSANDIDIKFSNGQIVMLKHMQISALECGM